MAQAGSATGAQRQAEQAIAARLTRYEQRQKRLRGPVAAYFRALTDIDKARTENERKAARLRAETDKKIAKLGEQTEHAVTQHQQAADAAIAELAELGESPREIAELLGASPAHVRATLAARTPPATPRRAGTATDAGAASDA